MPAGRPTDYTPEYAARICERLSDGKSLRAVCREEGMPAMSTVWLWVGKYPDVSHQSANAKQAGLEALAEDLLELSDDGQNDWMENNDPENPGYRLNGEHIQRSKLRVDTRKWLLSKLVPKKYGDKMTQEHVGNPLTVLISQIGPSALKPSQDPDGD